MTRAPKKKKKNMKGRKRGGASVPCPTCGKDSSVVITRRNGNVVIRQRMCKGRSIHFFDTTENPNA